MKSIETRLGLGTAAIGRPQYINIKEGESSEFSMETFKEKGLAVLESAYNRGVRYFDTAPGYGMAEDLILEWVHNKQDSSIEIATKWGYTYVADFNPKAIIHEVKEHSLKKLNEQWHHSQKLFPYLSTYQIHSATLETGVLDNRSILQRLNELKETYNIHVGLTTTGANQLEILKKALEIEVEGALLFDVFQVTYNIFDQSLSTLADEILDHNNRIVIKEALANGRVFVNENYPHYQKTYALLKRLSEKYEVGIDAIALRFCMDSISPYIVLSGASNNQHVTDNYKAATFCLEDKDILLLKEVQVKPKMYWKERSRLGWR